MKVPSTAARQSTQARVEHLVAEAKKEAVARDDVRALAHYREAAALMAGAPWLQQRTAELARKLDRRELAVEHYRRAAAAFIAAGFPKRALMPLRNAWQVSLDALASDPSSFIAVTLELGHVQRELGLSGDADALLASANRSLQAGGKSERVPGACESEPPRSGVSELRLRAGADERTTTQGS